MEDQAGHRLTGRRGVCAIVSLYAMEIHDVATDFAALRALVDRARAERAAAYGNTPAGWRSLAAGLLLRAVLGASAAPETDAHGKPTLPDGRQFNLSHAGDYAVLATANAAVGVDIERERPLDWRHVAKRFLHPDEYAYLCAQPDPLGAFFRIWTLKESYVKALGCGFSLPPASYCLLPQGESGAALAGDTAYCFRRYDDAFAGYRISVCAMENAFTDSIVLCRAADVR